jgi:hypothetical protein
MQVISKSNNELCSSFPKEVSFIFLPTFFELFGTWDVKISWHALFTSLQATLAQLSTYH